MLAFKAVDLSTVLSVADVHTGTQRTARFMEPVVVHGEWALVEDDYGAERHIPGEYKDDIGEDERLVEVVTGWGAQMSASGYMDQTEWTVFDTEEEAWENLKEYYMTPEEYPEYYEGEISEASTRTAQDQVLDDFTESYITTALWSTNDESDESGGVPLEDNYSVEDIAPECLQIIIADCKKFQEENADAIYNAEVKTTSTNEETAGHDFWLTRNGHGAGFWDGDWSEPEATQLDNASKAFGEIDLYVGDDKQIWCHQV